MLKFLFRTDVSPTIGMGHLRRCLALALELVEQNADVYFLCRVEGLDVSEQMPSMIKEWALMQWPISPDEDAREVIMLCEAKQIDMLIVDHYRADEEYQKILLQAGIRWLQFDGAARYPIWADWVLNMSPGASKALYDNLIKKNATLLLGPSYAILRREFSNALLHRDRTGSVRQVLLTFGGGDDRGAAIFSLDAIQILDKTIKRVVLMNSTNPRKDAIMRWCRDNRVNTKIVIDAEETAVHMGAADLGITAGGTTVFEMAALGVPLLILQIANNQVPISRAWEKHGYGINLGPLYHLNRSDLLRKTLSLMEDTKRRIMMSDKGRTLVDGYGARRVAEVLLNS
ncbi:MAG: UDP-2,4-diacetamido-2,4,6-trideoxy-beta-L-altropyranose hydrolase [Syntrophaceae bacterium]|nr:UDP-2,4-diacetamido-2,4,6-trideoxy-beta-L-altropyranose hydrolase [Syntrophaceae bacterium]